jgi:hypothetical protein
MAARKDPPEISDPAGHFPYKAATAHALREENPPMGPDGPDDDRLRAEDYISHEIIDATDVYVSAQADYVRSPGEDTYAAMQGAADALVAARQAHRAGRGTMNVVGIRSRRAGE